MQIIKPQQLILLNGRYQIGQQSHLGISVVAGFYLSDTQHFAHEADIWSAWQKAPMSFRVLDLAEPKPCAEFLLAGHAVSGTSVTLLDASVTLGELTRKWRIQGESQRSTVQVQPFTTMPLDHKQSFGGEGCAANPLGRGYLDGLSPVLMPVVAGRSQPAAPLASPGPVPQYFESRKSLLDKVAPQMSGKAYLETLFPGYPSSLDRRFFQLAPPEQCSSSETWPDDLAFSLTGFRPQGEKIEGRLPKVQARVFYREKRAPDRLTSLPLQRKTVWLLPDHAMGLVIFTGQLPLDYLLHEPLLSIMCALDSLDAPRSDAHFQQVAERRASAKASDFESLYDLDLMPSGSGMNVISTAAHAPDSLCYQPGPRQDYVAHYQFLREKIDEQQLHGREKDKPEMEKIDWETFPETNRKVLYLLADTPAERIEGEIFTCQSAENLHLKKKVFQQCQFIDCTFSKAVMNSCRFEYCQFENCTFDGAIFRDCTLHKSRFSDCVMQQVHIERSRLEQASFDNVRAITFQSEQTRWLGCMIGRSVLEDTVFNGGALENCSFSHCTLSGIVLRSLTLVGAIFERCNLRAALLEKVEISKGSLLAVEGDESVWQLCRLDSTTLHGDCTLRGALFEQTAFQQVGLRGINLKTCVFDQCTCHETNFSDADLSLGRFLQCEMAGCNFKEANMRGGSWTRSSLQQAMLYHADLAGVRFEECNLLGANFAMIVTNNDSAFHHCLSDGAVWYPKYQGSAERG
ncbi:hypothetical protein CRM79_22050 [Pantoea agglomerans]|nr:pentapeptide repeat-containing protein [Pantoea agglomerans]PEI02138.1 hypothetical protein CRM79_22050 [Pantoea agglomerans]